MFHATTETLSVSLNVHLPDPETHEISAFHAPLPFSGLRDLLWCSSVTLIKINTVGD